MSNIAYVRVSTIEQNESRQLESLKKYNIDKCYYNLSEQKIIYSTISFTIMTYQSKNIFIFANEYS